MTSTNEHEKDWAAKVKRGPYWPIVQGVLREGLQKLPLRKLMYTCATEWSSAERKKELDSLKERFAGLNRRTKRVANDMNRMAQQPYYDGTGDFLRSAARDLISVAAELEKHKNSLAAERSIRHTQAARSVAPLWFYCRAATGGKITREEVADLINAAREAESDRPRKVVLDGHLSVAATEPIPKARPRQLRLVER